MKNLNEQIEELLKELIAYDPSFARSEAEAKQLIHRLLLAKPDTKFNEQFAQNLREQLMKKAENLKTAASAGQKFNWRLALWPALAAIVLIVGGAALNRNQNSGVKNIRLLTVSQPLPTANTNNYSNNKPLPAGGSAGRGDEGGIRSSDGNRIILIQTSEGQGSEGQVVYYITIDGKDGRSFNFIGEAVFSPDSKQYAYAAGNASKQFIVLNGRELKTYDYVNTPAFSPNSSRFVYVASIGQQPNSKQFVVIDGVEEKQYQKVELAFSDYGRGFGLNSKHLVYSALENNQWFVVIDEKEGNKYDRVSMLTISADGKKVTYEAQTGSDTKTITENLD